MTAVDKSKLRYLRSLRDRNNLTPPEMHELAMADAAYGPRWWLNANDTAWLVTADRVAAFRARHDRWPSGRSADAEERAMFRWLSKSRVAAAGGGHIAWGPEREQHLDDALPGWRGGDDAAWRAVADQLVDFRQQHRRWPEQRATSTNELRLARWLLKTRAVAKGNETGHHWDDARQHYLNVAAPGWQGDDDRWKATADRVGAFRNQHCRWPSPTATDTDERKLANWLKNNRSAANGVNSMTWTDERQQYLNDVAAGWRGAA